MIKKTMLIFLCLFFVLSCGKKGDPEYKTYKYTNPLFQIV